MGPYSGGRCERESGTQVITLKPDLLYWPTYELRYDPQAREWRKTYISEPPTTAAQSAPGSPAAGV